jgi:hypothetical protein
VRPSCIMACVQCIMVVQYTIPSSALRYYCNHQKSNDGDGPMAPFNRALYSNNCPDARPSSSRHLEPRDEKRPTRRTVSGRRSSLPLPSVVGRCQVTVPPIPSSTSTVEPPFCLHALHDDLQQISGQYDIAMAQHSRMAQWHNAQVLDLKILN